MTQIRTALLVLAATLLASFALAQDPAVNLDNFGHVIATELDLPIVDCPITGEYVCVRSYLGVDTTMLEISLALEGYSDLTPFAPWEQHDDSFYRAYILVDDDYLHTFLIGVNDTISSSGSILIIEKVGVMHEGEYID